MTDRFAEVVEERNEAERKLIDADEMLATLSDKLREQYRLEQRYGDALRSILVRCSEGSAAIDWLPTIASIARAALSSEDATRPTGDGA